MTETLVLRMLSRLHEVFIEIVVEEIQKRLRTFLTADHRSRAFAQKIDHNGSGRLEIKSEDNCSRTIIKRDPDAIFFIFFIHVLCLCNPMGYDRARCNIST